MQHDLRPPGQPPGKTESASPSAHDESTRMQGLYRMVWVLFGLVLVLTVAVLVILPSMVGMQSSDQAAVAPPPVVINQPAPLPSGVQRHDAEQALQGFLRLRAQPGLKGIEIWAARDWQAAMETAANGDDFFGHGNFSDALSAYQAAGNQLEALLKSRPQRLLDTLDSGWQMLHKNSIDQAVNAFEQVLAMQPDHVDARLGLARAKVRHQVLGLLEQGQQAEAAGDLVSAADAYTDALQLDPVYIPAQGAMQKVQTELVNRAFYDAMSQALRSLDNGQLGQAEEALKAAMQIYPDDPAVLDTHRRLKTAQRQSTLNRLRRQGRQYAASENWSAAADIYRNALAVDTQATFARSGLAHAEQRLQLHAQLDHYLGDTMRLSSDEPLANAHILLQSNRQVATNEPVLTRKIAALKKAVDLAETPVELMISSDGRTEVAIYHVGRLGKFQQKRLTLKPGRYTVTGHCPGFRDVRKVITLRSESGTFTLNVRCEEAI